MSVRRRYAPALLFTVAALCGVIAVALVLWHPTEPIAPGFSSRCGSALSFVSNGAPRPFDGQRGICGDAAAHLLVSALIVFGLGVTALAGGVILRNRRSQPALH